MKRTILLVSVAILACALAALAQDQPRSFTPEQLRQGVTLYPNKGLPDQDPMPLVKRFEGLRTTDVLDALQAVGLQGRGVMDKTIRPLWCDNTDKVAHRFHGVAITHQYVPTNKPLAGKMPYPEFKKWHGHWCGTYAPETFAPLIRPGHAVVVDAQGIEDTGFVGSNNTLNWYSRGMTGVVTNGNCLRHRRADPRKDPRLHQVPGRRHASRRIESGSINVSVVVCGVLVRPGDVVVGDGDGVVVVPIEHVEEVLKIAHDIAKGDKAGRLKLYQKSGKPSDATVR